MYDAFTIISIMIDVFAREILNLSIGIPYYFDVGSIFFTDYWKRRVYMYAEFVCKTAYLAVPRIL